MALSNSAHLESLKTARDAITLAMASGQTVISYQVGLVKKETANPGRTLLELEKLIELYEAKTASAARSRYRVAGLKRAV